MLKLAKKKLAISALLLVSAIGAFATLGEGSTKGKSSNSHKSLLSNKTMITPGTFTLKSGYNFRGSQVINFESDRYINLNTVVTYQKGNTTYVMPLKKKVLLDKVTFNPNPATRY